MSKTRSGWKNLDNSYLMIRLHTKRCVEDSIKLKPRSMGRLVALHYQREELQDRTQQTLLNPRDALSYIVP